MASWTDGTRARRLSTRRQFLATTGVGLCAAAAGGCDAVASALSRSSGAALPERLTPPSGLSKDPYHHLLDRAAFGPWPGDLERTRRMGAEAWIDEQLSPGSIDDSACEARTRAIDVGWIPDDLVFELRPEDVESQLVTDTLLRAIYSRRQLQEVMVGFWLDHFNVAITKSLCTHLEAVHVRDVVRPRALGTFRELLGAVTRSPAMLVYLDGRENRRQTPTDVANENHARELLELHTLGVRTGYTQRDVMEAARCLSGWVVDERWAPGRARFVPERHDDGDKVVLGARISRGGGSADVDHLLDLLCAQPACARYVCRRLCAHLVCDDPPLRVVERATHTFASTGGHIGRTVRTVLLSPELGAATEAKLKRPFRFVASALRSVGADTHARGELGARLARMGQAPFRWPTPDGYPDRGEAWLGTLPARWSFALALAESRLEGTRVELPALRRALGAPDGPEGVTPLVRHLLGRAPTLEETEPLRSYVRETGDDRRVLALALSSPAFQRH